MLYIDYKKLEITKQNIYVGRFTNHSEEGYNICIKLEFINNDNKGYLHLNAGFEKNNDINAFLNKEYNGIPFENNDNQYIFFEVFDTKKFLDTEIESKIIIRLKDMKDNKVETSFEVNDELIKIKFDGCLDVINVV